MRFSTALAFLFAASVFFIAAYTSTKNPYIFFNLHATLVVMGGTIAAAAISFGFNRLKVLAGVIIRRVIFGHKNFDPVQVIRDLMNIAEAYRTRSPELRNIVNNLSDPFIKEGMEAVFEQMIDPDDLIRILRTRSLSIYARYHEEAMKFKALAKFPPAFGLMGAVMGMIGIMAELGNSGASASIGPSLALALVGTLYGVALANLIILPLSENLLDSAREIKTKNLIITEGISLIIKKRNPLILSEELNSFLLANERLDWRKKDSATNPANSKAS